MVRLQKLMDRVRREGLRVTRQRVLILQALCELDGHANAEEVHRQVALHRRDVDLSTVYRNLELLRDARILSQTDLGHGCAEYEVMGDTPHHHLVCRRCGHIQELDHVSLDAMGDAIRERYGFEPILDHWAIFGVCAACSAHGTDE
ncbi:MAG TPA: transcriptional repressor [Anaerolineae bacterium]|nr:transcriptional repressor [Anaerolineae bacterium]